MTTAKQRDGALAEELAATLLERNGLAIVTRNYRCRAGEIDLVARDGATLVFVEVRFRSASRFGGAAASIDARKRERIVRAAQHYLTGRAEQPCRFDVVLLDRLDPRAVEWIRDAFDA
jgi:putative endonuclease